MASQASSHTERLIEITRDQTVKVEENAKALSDLSHLTRSMLTSIDELKGVLRTQNDLLGSINTHLSTIARKTPPIS